MSRHLPRRFLRPVLMLLLAEEPSHGYDLLEKVNELGLEKADAGGLYRTLRTMEQEDLVESWWEPSESGPPRRSYQLTEEGEEWLHLEAGELRETLELLQEYLARCDQVLAEKGITNP